MRDTRVSSLYRYLIWVINRTREGLLLTHHGRFQACRVSNGDKGVIHIIQADLASCLEFVNVVEQPEGKRGTWFFPRCREPLHMHKLSTAKSGGAISGTETVGDTEGMNTGEIEESELGWGRWYLAAFTDGMAELIYNTEVGKRLGGEESSSPPLRVEVMSTEGAIYGKGLA